MQSISEVRYIFNIHYMLTAGVQFKCEADTDLAQSRLLNESQVAMARVLDHGATLAVEVLQLPALHILHDDVLSQPPLATDPLDLVKEGPQLSACQAVGCIEQDDRAVLVEDLLYDRWRACTNTIPESDFIASRPMACLLFRGQARRK